MMTSEECFNCQSNLPNNSFKLFHISCFVLFQPERILGDEYSIRSELWSLGVSLLEVKGTNYGDSPRKAQKGLLRVPVLSLLL